MSRDGTIAEVLNNRATESRASVAEQRNSPAPMLRYSIRRTIVATGIARELIVRQPSVDQSQLCQHGQMDGLAGTRRLPD